MLCPTCRGDGEELDAGRDDGVDLITCHTCHGAGLVSDPTPGGDALESARRWAVHHENTAALLAGRLAETLDVLGAAAAFTRGTTRRLLESEASRIVETLEEAAGV